MIRTAILAAAIALASGGAMAQGVTQADVGSFLRDANGHVIGSLKAINGETATIWIGFVNTPGNHLATVPLTQLASNDGRVVLDRPSTLAAR